jgi:hypothetical protein
MTIFRTATTTALTGLILLSFSASVADAKEKQTYVQGMAQCTAWCDAHNQTSKSRRLCYARCDNYWVHNASDGQQYQIDGM